MSSKSSSRPLPAYIPSTRPLVRTCPFTQTTKLRYTQINGSVPSSDIDSPISTTPLPPLPPRPPPLSHDLFRTQSLSVAYHCLVYIAIRCISSGVSNGFLLPSPSLTPHSTLLSLTISHTLSLTNSPPTTLFSIYLSFLLFLTHSHTFSPNHSLLYLSLISTLSHTLSPTFSPHLHSFLSFLLSSLILFHYHTFATHTLKSFPTYHMPLILQMSSSLHLCLFVFVSKTKQILHEFITLH